MAFNKRIKCDLDTALCSKDTACEGQFHEKTEDFPGCGLSTRTLGSPLVVIAEGVGVPLFNKRKKHSTEIYYDTTGVPW
jgi:hypothetical protein